MNETLKHFLTTFVLLFLIFSAALIVVVMLIAFRGGAETIEQRKWCKQHHPQLTFDQCSIEAGW
jgi:disulfide bond formation protein DsbB